LIPELLEQAAGRVDRMIAKSEGFSQTATHYLPENIDLATLRESVKHCAACDLHDCATQAVFGVGPADAETVLVGEQPGDAEDIAGEPFVGPAGKLLDEVLAAARIDRDSLYITNVVKHFKFTEQETARGKRRLHQKPDSREIYACRPWLEAELTSVKPDAIVCLGATAAQALIGRDFRITKQRGAIVKTEWSDRTVATWHPAAILRMPNEQRRKEMTAQLIEDLSLAVVTR
jgi:DNA polymerase